MIKSFCLVFGLFLGYGINYAIGAESGMPQLNPEFWMAQIFWLILVFSSLYIILWKIFFAQDYE